MEKEARETRLVSPFDDGKLTQSLIQLPHSESTPNLEGEKKKKKRNVDPVTMIRLCRNHGISNLLTVTKSSMKVDLQKDLDKLHPIDRHAHRPINRRSLYETNRFDKRKKIDRSSSTPTLMDQVIRRTNEMREYVDKAYQVDITKFNLKTIRRPSFVRSQLDIGCVSPFSR